MHGHIKQVIYQIMGKYRIYTEPENMVLKRQMVFSLGSPYSFTNATSNKLSNVSEILCLYSITMYSLYNDDKHSNDSVA